MERERFGDVTHLALHLEGRTRAGGLWNLEGARETEALSLPPQEHRHTSTLILEVLTSRTVRN